MIKLVYLARLRESFGRADEEATLADTVKDVRGLLEWLRQRGGAWECELAPGRSVRVAINHRMASASAAVRDGDEVALFPPVTGG